MEEQQRIVLGEYLPDVPPLSNPGLVAMRNALPIAGGYSGVLGLSPVAGFTPIGGRPRGGVSSIDRAGNPFNFVGTRSSIYRLKESGVGTEDVTRTSGAYGCANELRWEATVFRELVIFVNPADRTQVFHIRNSTNFENLGNDLTEAPRGSTISLMGQGQFVMIGNTFDNEFGRDETVVRWCALNDPYNWPLGEVGVALSAGRQPLAGDGGAVQRVIGGLDVGAIFQERSIFRCDFIGGNAAFAFTPVENARGLLVPQLAVPFGRNIFFLSEDGFYLFDYTTSQPAGRERVDRTFLADFDFSNAHRASAAADPDNQRIWILYPGQGNVGGRPNRVLVYDWGLNQFSRLDIDAEMVARVVGVAGVSLDSPGIIGDPNAVGDDPAFPDGGVDSAGLGSFDDRVVPAGGLTIGGYTSAFELAAFNGAGLEAEFTTGRRELAPGFRSLANRARVLVDSRDATLRAAGISRTNDDTIFGPEQEIDEDGDAPLRVDGRYHAFKLSCPPGFTNALGMDVYFQRSGRR